MAVITVTSGDSLQNKINTASSGDTVEVQSGTFTESVKITTSDITLQSASGYSPTIKGDGVGTGSQPHAAIHVDDGSGPVRNVTIDGFTVRNPNGKFGIFAGTGTTNSSPDGIGGLVVRNNTIKDISTSSGGGSLTGGPAGIGIRGDYGTSGNPGIEIRNNEVTNVQSGQNSQYKNVVGITLKSLTGDAGFGKDSSGNDKTDSASPPATDTDIVDNDISNINGGKKSRTKGISVSGEFEDVLVESNSISNIKTGNKGSGGDALAITFTENGSSYSGNKYDIDDDGNGERIGPRDFEIKGNDINQVNAASAAAVFIGGYEDLGDHTVTENNIDSGAVSRQLYNQGGFQHSDADTLIATNNWWGDSSGPSSPPNGTTDAKTGTTADGSGVTVVGKVNFDPFDSKLELRSGSGEVSDALFVSDRLDQNNNKVSDTTGNGKETAEDDKRLAELSEEGRLDNLSGNEQNKLDYDGDGEVTFDDIVTKVFERKDLL